MTNPRSSSPGPDRGIASARGSSMEGPDDSRTVDRNLRRASVAGGGESVEDPQRDRDSKGVRNGYDDSLRTPRGGDDTRDHRGLMHGD